jgi:pSer/pThr/pTyr-binding forkhead associated (FHA) protein
MQIKLKLVGGSHAGQEIAVTGSRFRIGRGVGCQLRPRSDAVAEQHCEFVIEPGQVTLNDLTGKGDTFVNGKRMEGSCVLRAGDRIKAGPIEVELQVIVRLAGQKKPKVNSVGEAAERMASGGRDELDVDDWLNDASDAKPSRYAAQLSADELRALSSPQNNPPPAADSKPSSPSDTGNMAAEALNRLNRRR